MLNRNQKIKSVLERAAKRDQETWTAHISILEKKGRAYAELRQKRKGQKLRTKLLGPCDILSPVALLEISLHSVKRLTLKELEALLVANKNMREPFRKPGRPKKST